MFASSPAPAESEIVTPQADGRRQSYEPFSVNVPLGTQADFYEPSTTPAVRERLIDVVDAEGPISLMLATRRVAASWGLTRAGSRIQDRVDPDGSGYPGRGTRQRIAPSVGGPPQRTVG